jgi:hypothetical protein
VTRLLACSFWVCTFLSLIPSAISQSTDLRYFSTIRGVRVEDASRQNYLVLDPEVWQKARPDLADLRLYDGDRQVAYVHMQARGSASTGEHEVKILNLARIGDHAEFDLDMQGVPEYDHVRLKLDARNFVASASIEGREELKGGKRAPWPTPSTLYDFSTEKLGSNFTIALPAWNYRFVHVKLGREVEPKQVLGAFVANLQERKAAYIPAGACKPASSSDTHQSRFFCDLYANMPVDRVVFSVSPNNANFRRAVVMEGENKINLATGEISRIHARRGGQTVASEDVIVRASICTCKQFTVIVENGDDPSLEIQSIEPQSFQRRLYFDPAGRTNLKLYYGDAKLGSPNYDYAKIFTEEPNAAEASLDSPTANPTSTPRPDDRPWSERHKAMLWIAMVFAVAVLAWLAVRGLREKPIASGQ